MSADDKILEVKNLNVSFKKDDSQIQIIKGVSFDIKKGQLLGIVGESGSGKSVTSLAIMNLLASNAKIEGEILFQGKVLTPADLKTKIRMIFQDPQGSLNPVISVGEQMIDALKAIKNISTSEARRESIEALKSVGIHEPELRLSQYSFELSGGMCQRVMIAMSLLSEPELLIADEPTTALDVTIQKQILNLIKNLQKRKNMTVMLISHDMGVISAYSDSICVMFQGKVREFGPTDQVLTSPQDKYTQELIKCLPSKYFDQPRGFRLPSINHKDLEG